MAETRRSNVAARYAARGRRHGFTLIEAMIASVVLAISVVGVATMVTASAAQASVSQQDATALSLARELMEQTAGVPFAKPTPDGTGYSNGNTNSTTYDDVRDFAGYTDTVRLSTSLGTAGNAGDARSYSRKVTVTLNALNASSDFMLITVTVTPPSGQPVSLYRLVNIADFTRQGT